MDKKKLRLNLKSLKVKSFVTDPQASKIRAGADISADTRCIDPCGLSFYDTCPPCVDPQPTIAATCPNTCGDSCGGTCLNSCNGTCDSCVPCFPTLPGQTCPSVATQFVCDPY